MSKVKRYLAKMSWTQIETQEHPNGEFVLWQDYARLKADFDVMHSSKLVYFIHGEGRWANVVEENARLKAEVERLTQNTDKLCKHGDLEIARLKAENERLRKAGDAMACHLVCSDLPNDVCGDLMKNWNAAKEVQS